jgi:4-hydroxybenzoate polyprenyltransferase
VPGKWRTYIELLRLPAVFTVIADVTMAVLVSRGSLQPGHLFAILVASSSCLYLAGIVLNDVFDAEIDTRERPERPIPSGRIARASAAKLGWVLLGCGICLAWTAGFLARSWWPGGIGSLLAGCILLYDGVLKTTAAAPLVMGACRFLNVLFGMSLAASSRWPLVDSWKATEMAIALGIGTYITGLTWFARGEARPGSRQQLLMGTLVMLFGLVALEVSGRMELRPASYFTESNNWPVLWLALAVVILGRCLWAAWRLETQSIQIAVRNSIRALIVIDAAIVLGFLGAGWAWVIVALLVPMLLLERWASTT